jgi:hypothetical protein
MSNYMNRNKKSLLVNIFSNVMWTCFHSYAGLAIGVWLLTYLNTPSFHLSSTHFLIMLRIHLNIPHFTITHFSWYKKWSYHWWFGYPFVTLLMWEWVHCSPWCASRYHCNYYFGEWSSHIDRGSPPFP